MYGELPPDIYEHCKTTYGVSYDPRPKNRPPDYDGLEAEWPDEAIPLVHPPFDSRYELHGRGPKAWVERGIQHHVRTGKSVVFMLSVHEPIYMLLAAGAKVIAEGRVRCLHTKTGKPHPHGPTHSRVCASA